MKGYKFTVWLQTDYGNSDRPSPIIHARNLKEAWEKFKKERPLEKNEWVYRVDCLGSVRKVIEVRYEYIPLKKPRFESRY